MLPPRHTFANTPCETTERMMSTRFLKNENPRVEVGVSTARATKFLQLAAAFAMTGFLAGCAGGGAGGPMAASLPMGQSCGSIRSELRRLDNRGVPSKVERLNAGRRLSPKNHKLAQRYKQLLDSYLAARCHV